MIVVATDAPLDAKDLEAPRRARHLRAGAHRLDLLERQRRLRDRVFHASGPPRDRPPPLAAADHHSRPTRVSGLFEATLDATEEAVYNSLLKATDTTGNGRTVPALPVDQLQGAARRNSAAEPTTRPVFAP